MNSKDAESLELGSDVFSNREANCMTNRFFSSLVVSCVLGVFVVAGSPKGVNAAKAMNSQEKQGALELRKIMSEIADILESRNDPDELSRASQELARMRDRLSMPGSKNSEQVSASAGGGKCPSAGASVVMGRVMNSAFVEDFIDCDIETTGKFESASGGYMGTRLAEQEDKVPFVVTAPNAAPTLVLVPKAKSDLVFELSKGDEVVIRGGPRKVPKSIAHKGAYFDARSIRRVERKN